MLIHTRRKALAQGPIPVTRHRIDLIRRLVPVRGWLPAAALYRRSKNGKEQRGCSAINTSIAHHLCIFCAYIEEMGYQRDAAKAQSNLRKHGIDFADAVGVFEDEWAFTCKEEDIGLGPASHAA